MRAHGRYAGCRGVHSATCFGEIAICVRCGSTTCERDRPTDERPDWCASCWARQGTVMDGGRESLVDVVAPMLRDMLASRAVPALAFQVAITLQGRGHTVGGRRLITARHAHDARWPEVDPSPHLHFRHT